MRTEQFVVNGVTLILCWRTIHAFQLSRRWCANCAWFVLWVGNFQDTEELREDFKHYGEKADVWIAFRMKDLRRGWYLWWLCHRTRSKAPSRYRVYLTFTVSGHMLFYCQCATFASSFLSITGHSIANHRKWIRPSNYKVHLFQ